MTPSLLRRLLTPIGLTMALMFMAVGVALLYQYHSKFSVLEMVYNVVVFFLLYAYPLSVGTPETCGFVRSASQQAVLES